MSIFKDVFLSTATVFPIAWLNRVSSIEVLLPYHHVVSDEYLPHIKGLYNYKNEQQFKDDLDWLLRYRTPVHPDELLYSMVEKKPFPVNTFLLTFDDGFREVFELIAPILLKKGVPAIFFINPSFIDNKELFYRCKLSLVVEKIKDERNKKLLSKVADLLSTGRSDFEHIKNNSRYSLSRTRESRCIGRVRGNIFPRVSPITETIYVQHSGKRVIRKRFCNRSPQHGSPAL